MVLNAMVLKSFLALAAASALLVGSAILYRRRRSAGFVLLFLGAVCFIVVALAHIFEALGILRAAGWGRPHSLGHYIDLLAAVLGLTLVLAALLFNLAYRRAAKIDARERNSGDPG